ncbi:MAG: MFS transporter, partial [Candidatus Thermoplasmatota archaeon]|nr:MFS transporter [Candidatus Thermoplasmatota archaeon]
MAEGAGVGKNDKIKNIFRAFESRNYRLYFAGQGISLIGTWMQQTAMSWIVYRLTGSLVLLGVVSFAGQIPAFLLSPVAGVLSDRLNRHRVLLATQTFEMLQAFALWMLVVTNSVQVWHIIALAVFLGIVSAFDMPTRQAFTAEMIEKREHLGNAIALNSAMFNGARLIGPSVAGIAIAVVGEATCFLMNAISFVAVIIALLAMRIKPKEKAIKTSKMLQGLNEGFSYAFGNPGIRSVILLFALVSLVGMPYAVLMPAFARDVLHGGPETLGFLMAATGAGAVIGAIILAARKDVTGLEKIIPATTAIFGVGVVLASFAKSIFAAIPLLILAGFGIMVQMAATNT